MPFDFANFDAVLFDFSGTLFRLEQDESWLTDLTDHKGEPLDVHHQAELMRRMTAPVGQPVEMDAAEHHAWTNRDLDPSLHRQAYLTVLRKSGVAREDQAIELYERSIDPDCWSAYPDTAEVLAALKTRGIKIAVLSNIAFDIRPTFADLGVKHLVDQFVLSFEVGAMKPDPRIFEVALGALGADPARTLMIGDSEEADGAARKLGCAFALVEPLPVTERTDGLRNALERNGIR
ncbi:HAD family hydrolase [Rhodococcus marinonascens]|uniref:HAD family hydrolase n=1 Tax=Rhodococcus marinonascens TaxID=38311 RepID=UPI000934A669|nr:HAD-IA family hydrolase [Rhodococcus marinonascens]